MDAEQFSRWIAFFSLDNEKYREDIQTEIDQSASELSNIDFVFNSFQKKVKNG